MRNLNKKIAIQYASSHDDFGMDLIKSTRQFPNYYHNKKKMLLNRECDFIYFVPSAKSGIEEVLVANITDVRKIYNYDKINPLWTMCEPHKADSDWDMLVELGAVVSTTKTAMEAKGLPTKGIQGGIHYIPQ